MKLLTKLLLIVFASIFGMVMLGGFAVTSLRNTMLQERQQSMRLLVSMAAKQVEHFKDLEKSGKLSREDAKASALDAVRALRVGENYVFIRTGEKLLLSLVHPDPRKEGGESNGGTLPNGQAVTDVYLEALKTSNPAFVSIYTKRPTGDVLVPKISAIMRVPDWEWVIGTGDFVDDINKVFEEYILQFLVVGAIALVFVLALTIALTRGILKQLGGEPRIAAESMKRIANGDLTVDIILNKNDSNSLMASLKVMQMKLKNITSSIQDNATSLVEEIQTVTANASAYGANKSDENLSLMLKSMQKLTKIASVLRISVSRINS